MIQHAVSMVWKKDVGAQDVGVLVELLEALPEEIPVVREYRFGEDLGLREGNADFAVLAMLDDESALKAYLEHPFHLRIREQLERMTESRRAVQFELAPVEEDVRALYSALIDAWNGRDAEAFAALFAQDGTAIGFDGSEMAGRAQIASALGEVFGSHPTAPYVTRVRSVRGSDFGVAVVRAVAGMVPPGQEELNPDLHAQHSLVAEGGLGGWRIVLFQNTPAQFHGRPEAVAALTQELGSGG